MDVLKSTDPPLRSQDEKLYVQDLVKQDAKMIKEWIHDRGGNIYISG